MALTDVPQFAKAPGKPGYAANTTVNFGGIMAKYVKLTINSNWPGVGTATTTGLSEVRFFYLPVQARLPQPATGATGQGITTTLKWHPGRDVIGQHGVLRHRSERVAQGAVAAQTVATCAYDPGILAYGTTYYWRVDEIGTGGTYPGEVWSFTTQAIRGRGRFRELQRHGAVFVDGRDAGDERWSTQCRDTTTLRRTCVFSRRLALSSSGLAVLGVLSGSALGQTEKKEPGPKKPGGQPPKEIQERMEKSKAFAERMQQCRQHGRAPADHE